MRKGLRSARNAASPAPWAAIRLPRPKSAPSSSSASTRRTPSGAELKILVAGAGPAGLYFSYLAKRRHPDWQIRVLEQNAADATFGFGVVFSDKALEFLPAHDPAPYQLATPQMESWTDLTVVHRGIPVVIDGIGFAAIGRLHLLPLLPPHATSVRVA